MINNKVFQVFRDNGCKAKIPMITALNSIWGIPKNIMWLMDNIT